MNDIQPRTGTYYNDYKSKNDINFKSNYSVTSNGIVYKKTNTAKYVCTPLGYLCPCAAIKYCLNLLNKADITNIDIPSGIKNFQSFSTLSLLRPRLITVAAAMIGLGVGTLIDGGINYYREKQAEKETFKNFSDYNLT